MIVTWIIKKLGMDLSPFLQIPFLGEISRKGGGQLNREVILTPRLAVVSLEGFALS